MSAKPGYEEALSQIGRLRKTAGEYVRVLAAGKSVEGRDIPAVLLTDASAPVDDKQHVLIVAGQHASEESGRAIAMELMDYLASDKPEARQILARQAVVVVPCANPDGAVRDISHNAEGVDVAHTYAFDAPAASPEGRCLENLAAQFVPDIVVDIHGRAGGGMKELCWLMPAWGFSSDRYFLTAMSMAMASAGEEAGYPQCELQPAGALQKQEGNRFMLGERLAWRFKSLCLGMETIEQYYREADWRATGLARLRRLLRFGMEDAFGLGEAGYPNSLVSGNRIGGLKAHGRTAAQRRANRVELVRFLRENFAVADRGGDGPDGCAKVRVSSATCNGKNPRRFALLLRFKKPCRIDSIEWRGAALTTSDEHGYKLWDDGCSQLLQVNLAEAFGGPERELAVRYDCPYLGR